MDGGRIEIRNQRLKIGNLEIGKAKRRETHRCARKDGLGKIEAPNRRGREQESEEMPP
jgi:hypothetical protein